MVSNKKLTEEHIKFFDSNASHINRKAHSIINGKWKIGKVRSYFVENDHSNIHCNIRYYVGSSHVTSIVKLSTSSKNFIQEIVEGLNHDVGMENFLCDFIHHNDEIGRMLKEMDTPTGLFYFNREQIEKNIQLSKEIGHGNEEPISDRHLDFDRYMNMMYIYIKYLKEHLPEFMETARNKFKSMLGTHEHKICCCIEKERLKVLLGK
jgi:hypothetical protein